MRTIIFYLVILNSVRINKLYNDIYPAPKKWFRNYLKRQGCSCTSMGGFEIWSKEKEVHISKNCVFTKQRCNLLLRKLELSFKMFELSLTKHKESFKKRVRAN